MSFTHDAFYTVVGTVGWLVGQLTWSTFLFTVLFVVLIFFLWKMQSDKGNTYDLRDLLLDERTRRASLTNHTLLGMAIMAVWVVVTLVNRDKEVTELVLGVLGIFVLGKVAKRGLDAFDDRRERDRHINVDPPEERNNDHRHR